MNALVSFKLLWILIDENIQAANQVNGIICSSYMKKNKRHIEKKKIKKKSRALLN